MQLAACGIYDVSLVAAFYQQLLIDANHVKKEIILMSRSERECIDTRSVVPEVGASRGQCSMILAY